MEEMECVVERITFQNPDNGFVIFKASIDNGKAVVPVVGTMPDVKIGSCVVVSGDWVMDKRFGRQFKVSSWRELMPTTLYGIKKYLGSGLIKGIGGKLAGRIVEYFGKDTISVIENSPERLKEVNNIGKKRIQMIHDSWVEKREVNNIMLFLKGHDIGLGYATKIFKRYGMDSIKRIQENPYRLCKDIWGIGFLLADRVAAKLGFQNEHPFRCKSGLLYTLSVLADRGNTYYPEEALMDEAMKLLGVPRYAVENVFSDMVKYGAVIEEGNRVYLPEMYEAEHDVADKLCELVAQRSRKGVTEEEAYAVGRSLGIEYDRLQAKALADASRFGVMVLTGGPGTGKTTTVQGILAALHRCGQHVLLAAPTGRAAKRMEEATGQEAMTIHRLLEYSPVEGCKRNSENPLAGDALIVDECSMIDINLMRSLLDAVPNTMSVLLVGDVDQLPSVGPGNVLRDIIYSGVCPVIQLTHIFRQALSSNIVVNAHKVNRGQMVQVDNSANSDFFVIRRNVWQQEEAAELIVDLVSRRLPAKFNVKPSDIQVLAPMRKGPAGVNTLNFLLQQALNPGDDGIRRRGILYRVGDKVMQLRNNYDKEVFNGDIGFISGIDTGITEITVDFDGKEVVYDASDFDEITHAYATTIHKSQGCEYQIVVMPLFTSHYVMLQRNLLYTGITRAKRIFVLVTDNKAVSIATHNCSVSERCSFLADRLREEAGRVISKTA